MARVVAEVSSTTNIVEKIYPYAAGMSLDPEPGRYAVANVLDANVALGWLCNTSVVPFSFGPNPNPPVNDPQSQVDALNSALAQLSLAQASVVAALALG